MTKKYSFIIWIILLLILYTATRLVNLTRIPIFTDEAIYLRWAQIALHDSSLRFISLTDGKQPSFVWIVMIFMKFIRDPLIAGRIASVMSGFFGLTGIVVLAWYLFRKRIFAFWVGIFYLVSPFFLLYDRLALYDSLTAAFFIWGMVFSVVLARTVRLDAALILGMVIGGGVLTKSSAFLSLALLPISLLVSDWKKLSGKVLIKWFSLVAIVSSLSLTMYNALRLSPWFYIIGRKNEEFVYSISDWLAHPIQFFLPNLDGLTKWLTTYLTYGVVFLVLLSLFLGRSYLRERLFLFLTFLIPFIYLGLFGKVLFPRYLLFMTVPLYLLAVFSMVQLSTSLKNNVLSAFIVLVVLLNPTFFDYQILFHPENAPLPETDRHQYIDDWPSGYGVDKVIAFLKSESRDKKVTIVTEGTFGLFPYSIELYLYQDKNIEIIGHWPMHEEFIQKELVTKARQKPVYLVFKDTQNIPGSWPLKLIQQTRRGNGPTFLRLYQVLPSL